MDIRELLKNTVERRASDLHIKAGEPPILRVDGNIERLNLPTLDTKSARDLIYQVLTEEQITKLEKTKELDTSTDLEGFSRFRINVGEEMSGVYATIRVIPYEIPEAKNLGFPTDIWKSIVDMNYGLVLVTGVTCSGKSTTLASLVQEINRRHKKKIICIEDPIEYAHRGEQSMVIQREVGKTTDTFDTGVKYAMRQNPDVLLIGEVRDKETAHEALRAAETGHLVLTTLHTRDAPGSIGRYIDMFQGSEQEETKALLSQNLRCVLSQQLIPYTQRDGRVLAIEVMVNTPGVQNQIREDKRQQLKSSIETGAKYGMMTMNQCLEMLCRSGKITPDIANMYRID